MPQRIQSGRVILSTAEASKIAQLSQEYINRLVRAGRIEGFKAGHDWLLFEDSLQTFLAHPRKSGPRPNLASSEASSSMPKDEAAKMD